MSLADEMKEISNAAISNTAQNELNSVIIEAITKSIRKSASLGKKQCYGWVCFDKNDGFFLSCDEEFNGMIITENVADTVIKKIIERQKQYAVCFNNSTLRVQLHEFADLYTAKECRIKIYSRGIIEIYDLPPVLNRSWGKFGKSIDFKALSDNLNKYYKMQGFKGSISVYSQNIYVYYRGEYPKFLSTGIINERFDFCGKSILVDLHW